MVRARVVLVGGLLLLLVAFDFGTQPRSASLGDQSYACGAAISTLRLVPGTPDQNLSAGSSASVEQRQTALACKPVFHQARVLTFSARGLGALLALLGWSAIRERVEAERRELEASPA